MAVVLAKEWAVHTFFFWEGHGFNSSGSIDFTNDDITFTILEYLPCNIFDMLLLYQYNNFKKQER